MDYDKLYSYGEANKFINTVIEIPKGSNVKVEFDRAKKTFYVDRVEPAIFAKPSNYGFIPQTTDEDGDALDTLVVNEEVLSTGLVTKARVIGVMRFIDDGENDHKIVCIVEDDRNLGARIQSLDDLGDQWKKQVEFHFNHYKDLKSPGKTQVKGWGDAAEAWEVIEACRKRFNS